MTDYMTDPHRHDGRRDSLANYPAAQWPAIKQHLETAINGEFKGVMAGLNEVMHQEWDYQSCSYRRTACKALELHIKNYNLARSSDVYEQSPNYRRQLGLQVAQSPGYCRLESFKWEEKKYSNVQKYQFDQFGQVAETHSFLVDPGRFWSYDLVRSRQYGERPL